MSKLRKPYPLGTDRLGWHQHYAKQFSKTGTPQSAQLACWYLLLHLSNP